MKHYKVAALLAFVLLALTLTIAIAGCPEYEDPALCINGQWLVVNAAYERGIQVTVPDGVAYGKDAGCQMPIPAPPFVTNVVQEKGNGSVIRVKVQGELASVPDLTISYAGVVQTRSNNDHKTLNFAFDLP